MLVAALAIAPIAVPLGGCNPTGCGNVNSSGDTLDAGNVNSSGDTLDTGNTNSSGNYVNESVSVNSGNFANANGAANSTNSTSFSSNYADGHQRIVVVQRACKGRCSHHRRCCHRLMHRR
ncbi:hypothetical protein Acor_50780 [Acrocarpospora corrugata]|uniref:Uncharacterized protein n=2 Tax=Acrocarpospora corrugata TaxID=35763 RepID=A0A5M3W4Q2_9ACTN|nr:hypothetical protein Acor_50780 [Acrocarpospora corrugata]